MCTKDPSRFADMGYEYIEFFNGTMMPKLGLGTWNMTSEEAETSVEAALEAGYLLIDTAAAYNNEEGVGRAIQKFLKKGTRKREDLFITTKLWIGNNRREEVTPSLKKSLANLQLDYVDLYLIHCPVGIQNIEGEGLVPRDKDGNVLFDMNTDIVDLWKGMEEQVTSNRAKAIGVSNFNVTQIKKILDNFSIRPANLQVEMHARFRQKELMKFCDLNAISVTAYGTLGSPGRVDKGTPKEKIPVLLEDEIVKKIAAKHNKTPAQVLLRHFTILRICVIPKSVTPERIKSNYESFKFYLDEEDMDQLDSLDQGKDGRSFDFKFFTGIEKHPEYPFFD